MPVFNVITESGADYKLDTTHGYWYHRGMSMGRLCIFKISQGDADKLAFPWHAPEQWTDTEVPVVGRRMYLDNTNDWRISMPVASFTIEEEEDNDTKI